MSYLDSLGGKMPGLDTRAIYNTRQTVARNLGKSPSFDASADFPQTADNPLYVTASNSVQIDADLGSRVLSVSSLPTDPDGKKLSGAEKEALARIYRASGAGRPIVFEVEVGEKFAGENRTVQKRDLDSLFRPGHVPYEGLRIGGTSSQSGAIYRDRFADQMNEQIAFLARKFSEYQASNSDEANLLTVNLKTLMQANDSHLVGENGPLHGIEPDMLRIYMLGQIDRIAKEKAAAFAEFGIDHHAVRTLVKDWIFERGATDFGTKISPSAASQRLDQLLVAMKDSSVELEGGKRLLTCRPSELPKSLHLPDDFKKSAQEARSKVANRADSGVLKPVPSPGEASAADEESREQKIALQKIAVAVAKYEDRFENKGSSYNKMPFFGKGWQSGESKEIVQKIKEALNNKSANTDSKLSVVYHLLSEGKKPGASLMKALKDAGVLDGDGKPTFESPLLRANVMAHPI